MNKFLPQVIGVSVFGWMYFIEGAFLFSSLGLALTAFLLSLFVERLGKGFPLLELLLSIAALQWLLGPYLDYRSSEKHLKYFMYVPEQEYMNIVFPAVLSFMLAGFLLLPKIDFNARVEAIQKHIQKQDKRMAWGLLAVGFISLYLRNSVPGGLAFILFLASNLRYIGAAYLLFTDSSYKWPVFSGLMLLTLLSAIQTGMFHDFFLWSVLLFSVAAIKFRLSFLQKLSLLCLGFFLMFIIQSVKSDYREIIWSGKFDGDHVGLFIDLALNKLEGSPNELDSADEDEFTETNARLNQGWIISAIIENVPEREPFAEGETIQEAVFASLLPRFMNPSKKEAGGRENFMRFTGLMLAPGTSMGTSVLGEAYANYGLVGTIVFMGLWGAFLALFLRKVYSISQKHPTLLLWLPLIFLQVVKAETELVVVLNHLVKASIFVFGVYWISRKIFKVQL